MNGGRPLEPVKWCKRCQDCRKHAQSCSHKHKNLSMNHIEALKFIEDIIIGLSLDKDLQTSQRILL